MRIPKGLKMFYSTSGNEHCPVMFVPIYGIRAMPKAICCLDDCLQVLIKATGLEDRVWINVQKDRLWWG